MSDANLKYGHPDSEEAKQKAAERLAHEKGIERRAWLTLWRTYERCVEISELVWKSKLEEASAQQQTLAEQMRDRTVIGEPVKYVAGNGVTQAVTHLQDGAIPVPLFTPRDRAQFVKEVAATLLISADRQNLHVYFPKDKPDAETQPEAGNGSGAEAASGTSEEALDTEAGQVATQGGVNHSSPPQLNDLAVPLTT